MKSFSTGKRTVTVESRPGMVFVTVQRTDAKGREASIITALPTEMANEVALAIRDAALTSGALVAQDAALKTEQAVPVVKTGAPSKPRGPRRPRVG